MEQEKIIKLQGIKEEAEQLEKQLQLINENISDLNKLNSGLDELKNGNEILANIGRGIYVNAEIKEKKLLVDVGDKNIVKKSFDETKELISEQLIKIDSIKSEIINRINNLDKEMNLIIKSIEKNI